MIKINDILVGTIQSNVKGSAYFTSSDLPNDIYLNKNNLNKALNLDTVKIKVIVGNGDGRRIEGVVIEVVERFRSEYVGTIQLSEKFAFFISDSNKINVDFFIPLSKLNGAKEGEKVVAKITEWKDGSKNPNGEIIKVIGNIGDHETEIHSILEEFGLPYEFSRDVLDEAELISEVITDKEIAKRKDLRHLTTCTIDGYDAKDLDDALSLEWVDGNIKVYIHIADVSHYIKEGSEIHAEALNRSTSVYLCDRVVPMLPEKLSNNLCSLNPNTDKLVYSFIFTLDQNAKVIKEEFVKGIINSNYRLTYTEVQSVIEGGETHSTELKQALLDLDRYAKKLKKVMNKNGSLTFNNAEVKFKLDENNKPIDIFFSVQKDANFLIEQFMVLTNRRVCEFIAKKDVKSIHRTHNTPDPTKLYALKQFIETMGYALDLSNEDNIKSELNNLVKQVIGTPEETIVNNLIVRCMAKAEYQSDNIGHYGLGLQYYTHVTSPIRRFCDLQIGYQLSNILGNGGYPIKE